MQDAQLFDRLTDLRLDIQNPDAAISAAAQIKYDTIYFQSVSEEFDAAIQAADALNESDPDFYYSPLDDEGYQAFLSVRTPRRRMPRMPPSPRRRSMTGAATCSRSRPC